MSYAPLYVHQLRIAVYGLRGSELKILLYLASRADEYGTCFPSAQTMATEIGLHISTVYAALDQLEAHSWIIYHRKNQYDPWTKTSAPNVYQVNPALLMIRDECRDHARDLWHSIVGGDSLPRPTHEGSQGFSMSRDSSQSYPNQQQEPTTENQRHISNDKTNNNNQPTLLKTDGKNSTDDETQTPEKSEQERAGTNADTDDNETQTELPQKPPELDQRSKQRSKKGKGSAAPPGIFPKYNDPPSIVDPLGNSAAEELAQELREIGIAIPLARGLISTYGQEEAWKCLEIVKRGKWKKPGGAFRYLLQRGLADTEALIKPENKNYNAGKYGDFIES